MDVLSSRILLRPRDLNVSRAFYRDVLGLAVYREFGPRDAPGTVFFLGGGFLELSLGGPELEPTASPPVALWLQVRDAAADYDRVVRLGGEGARAPRIEPWGLIEARVLDPDGLPIHLVEVPPDHPLRRDRR